jgi:hypothetical protein
MQRILSYGDVSARMYAFTNSGRVISDVVMGCRHNISRQKRDNGDDEMSAA